MPSSTTRPTRSRWSSGTTDVLFATRGDLRRITGGNIYAQHMLAALRRAGVRTRVLSLNDRGAVARLRAARPRVLIVDTIAADTALPALDALRERGVRICTFALMERGAASLARRSDRVIAPSRALASALLAAGIPRSRIVVVPPGVDRLPAAPKRRGDRALCVANWTKEKGIRTLLAAIEWLPDVRLDLVGGTPDPEYAQLIRHDIGRARLRGRVRALGTKRGAALARLYQRASFFVLPSIRESYGMAVAEAIAAGLPVIACDIPAAREVTGGAALLVPRGKVDALTDAIDRVAHDARVREQLVRRSRARAKRFLTWTASERAFVKAVRALLSARGAGARRTRAGRPS